MENSLNVITRKFIELLRNAPGMEMDLNYAASVLELHKRRLYDITNVLEGIGYIKKKSKNNVQYVGDAVKEAGGKRGCGKCQGGARRTEGDLFEQVGMLLAEEREMDTKMHSVNEELKSLACDEENVSLAYVTYSDLKSLESFVERALFAIKTPPGTVLDLPTDAPMGSEAVLTLTAPEGRIDVFYIQEHIEGSL
jgi:transcription factor E2F3